MGRDSLYSCSGVTIRLHFHPALPMTQRMEHENLRQLGIMLVRAGRNAEQAKGLVAVAATKGPAEGATFLKEQGLEYMAAFKLLSGVTPVDGGRDTYPGSGGEATKGAIILLAGLGLHLVVPGSGRLLSIVVLGCVVVGGAMLISGYRRRNY
jgi:hypothetical protein